MATTYAELQAEIFAWINKAEIYPAIPTLIKLAEADFQRRIRCQKMVQRKTASITDSRLALPSDWLEAINLELTTGDPSRTLIYVSQHELDKVRDRTVAQDPEFYTITGTDLEFAPEPSGTHTVEMIYYGTITALADGNTSNWLLTSAPDLYLFASLVQTEMYLGNDARIPVWKERVEKIIADINGADERAKTSGGPLIPRIPTFD